jgi:hypothetical protein
VFLRWPAGYPSPPRQEPTTALILFLSRSDTRAMNKRGNPESLVASHPGNLNAVKQGIHSSRVIQARAAEIARELTQSFDFSAAERLAVQEAARCIAILEAIDRDYDERGLVDDEGTPRYLLNHRSRISRQLEQWLQKISAAIERNPASEIEPLRADLPEYVRALQGIALGRDKTATARDRLAALRELFKLERRGMSSYLEASAWDDPDLQRRWARVSRADELERLQSREQKFGITE